jgi:lipopolysaccharide transport system ATP-binding protein
MSDIAISLKNVSKYYKLYNSPQDRLKEALSFSDKEYHKKFYATKNLDLEIKKGEILGIVGKNGSGKSTLLKLIIGVLVPDEGSLKVNGKISALLELGSGFNPEFTGMQNIFFYGTILGFSKEEMYKKLDDIIAFADIGEFIDQPLKTYSSGMKSRLGFAVAVHIDPEILILDEVLAVGDDLFRRKSYAKMEEFFKAGKTILYVSHSANSINQLCSRAILLDKGSVIFEGEPKVVTAYYQKLLFSKPSDQKKINMQMHQKQKIISSSYHSKSKEKHTTETIQAAYYIDNMLSTTRIEHKNVEVEFIDSMIETEDGRRVNVLLMDESYYYSYIVRFDIDAEHILFGMQIKTIKGQMITGTNTKMLKQDFDIAKCGETYKVRWKFTCRLQPGNYYTNMSVFSEDNGKKRVLNRVTDALVFKVLSSAKPPFGGLTHLDQNVEIVRIQS